MLRHRSTKIFFDLLRAGLWKSPLAQLNCFPLSEQEWGAIYKLSIEQAVDGIVFDGLLQLPHELFPPRRLFIKWFVRKEKIEQLNQVMETEIAEQAAMFQAVGLSPLLIKGQGVAKCYTNPKSRICGDIDWVFLNKKDLEKAINQVKMQGLTVVKDSSGSALLKWKTCEMDLHNRMFDLYNPFLKDFLFAFMKSEKRRRQQIKMHDTTILLPSIMEQMLIVNTHIFRHLLSFGIGLRQVCDSAMLYANYHDQYDRRQLDRLYHYLGIGRWTTALHVLLVQYIGLPKVFLPVAINEDADVDWIMEDILLSGNFGFHAPRDKNNSSGTHMGNRRMYRSWFGRVLNYFPLAPMESMCFPVVHLYNSLTNRRIPPHNS
ncbi:nucleotidyltransferase family protein [Sphingobacterium ginsenosidimutans]|uniref:Nucleotidyltransferase family protein n=1 Tax=Sphingobacterium ginsenosidimutans TaxID=687845 RepID=A0ABP7ZQP1_9SPHI